MAASIKDVADFFRSGDGPKVTLKEFSDEWKALSDGDKAQLREGIGNGTLTY